MARLVLGGLQSSALRLIQKPSLMHTPLRQHYVFCDLLWRCEPRLPGRHIHGSVNTTFQLPPERPETPPRPSTVVPFGRDADFVERRETFDQIQAKCAAPGSRIALVGLGGVGKSQLAIELAYRIRERSPEKWVFWVHASNVARFEQSYRDIANCVKVPGWQNPKADIFQLVHDWLQDNGKGRWFLILDNFDDAGFLLKAQSAGRNEETSSIKGKSSQPLISYVPRRQNGSVLITTRSRNAALQLVEQRDIIAVKPMEKRDALALLQKKLGQQDSSEEGIELAAALEYMPLAIVQAAAYISQRRPRCSVQQYLEDFRRSDRKRTTLLDCEGGQLRRDWEAKNSIIITWQISFDYIRQTRPSAGDLLALMSFYDRQGIPELTGGCSPAYGRLLPDYGWLLPNLWAIAPQFMGGWDPNKLGGPQPKRVQRDLRLNAF